MAKKIVVLTLLVTGLLLTGCISTSSLVVVSPLPTPTAVAGTNIPFETILHEDHSGYRVAEPLLLLIDDPDSATPMLDMIGPNIVPDRQAQVVSYVQDLLHTPSSLVVLFRGDWPSSGYEVTIDRLVKQGNDLHVYAQFWEPGPVYPVTPAGTSSFHIVKLLQPIGSTDGLQLVLHSYPMIHHTPPAK